MGTKLTRLHTLRDSTDEPRVECKKLDTLFSIRNSALGDHHVELNLAHRVREVVVKSCFRENVRDRRGATDGNHLLDVAFLGQGHERLDREQGAQRIREYRSVGIVDEDIFFADVVGWCEHERFEVHEHAVDDEVVDDTIGELRDLFCGGG
jgi:hypothetical protein